MSIGSPSANGPLTIKAEELVSLLPNSIEPYTIIVKTAKNSRYEVPVAYKMKARLEKHIKQTQVCHVAQ